MAESLERRTGYLEVFVPAICVQISNHTVAYLDGRLNLPPGLTPPPGPWVPLAKSTLLQAFGPGLLSENTFFLLSQQALKKGAFPPD